MLLLLAAVVLSCVGVSTPSHCGVDPLPTNPEPDNVCSVYYNCTANAGENITIPCGAHQERSGVSFTYDIHYHNDERKIIEQVTTEFLTIPVTAVEDRSYVSCTPNNSMESSCYGLDIFYRPQEVPPVTIHQGQRNAHYCLSCQIKANPTPNCSWTIYTTEMGPYQCERNGTCPTVDPSGVTFPDSPREVCPMNQVPLPLPVYPGCVMEIDRLTPEYRYYQYICTAENALGIHNVNFGYRPIPFILCGGQDVTVQLTSTTPGVNVTIGDSETLDCRVTNVEPGGDILWYHNGTDLGYIQSIYSSETCILQSMLVLSNVTYADGGTYTCLFRDNVVSATESSTLFVRVNPRDQPASSTDSKKPSIYIIAGACGGVVLILLIVLFLAVVVYRSSNSIQFFLKWRLKEPEYEYIMNGKRVAFEYDVFLSFAEEDKKDVEEGLRHPLEKKGYHVCWHHTDFLAGRQITDNIEGNITASRKTIVVLSSDFYSSPHCRRELDFALQKLKNTRTYCVVPVLLRECGKLSSDITALTYLDATKNARSERLINRLCDSLGKPKKDVPGSTLLVQASQ